MRKTVFLPDYCINKDAFMEIALKIDRTFWKFVYGSPADSATLITTQQEIQRVLDKAYENRFLYKRVFANCFMSADRHEMCFNLQVECQED